MRDRAALLCLGITAGSLAVGCTLAMVVGGTYRAPDGLSALAAGGCVFMLLGALDSLHRYWSRITTEQSLLPSADVPQRMEAVFISCASAYAALLMLSDPFLFFRESYEQASLAALSFVPLVALIRFSVGRHNVLAVVGASLFITVYIAIFRSGSQFSDAGRGFFHAWR